MGSKSDEKKYMEGNYSSNIFVMAKEWWEDVQQANEIVEAVTYFEDYMAYLKEHEEEHHYLVDGAVLTCTRCTKETDSYYGESFCVPEEITERELRVTQNSTAKNGAGQCFATLKDSKKNVNIFSFGNCKNPPDREKEKEALMYASEDEELRKLGTCQYLMELNDKWENLIADTGYEKVTGENGEQLETITMEAILFCKHGGLIYPKSSGYIKTDAVEEEEGIENEIEKKAEEEVVILLEELGVSRTDVAIYVWKFFCDKGLSDFAVAGILGNIYSETGGTFEPDSQKGQYYGLFQIGGSGASKLIEKGGGGDGWKDVGVQCEFAWEEYSTGSDTGWLVRYLNMGNSILEGTKENFENASSASEAALIWGTSFERCYDGTETIDGKKVFKRLQQQEQRVEKAEDMYEIFIGVEWE